VRAWDDGEAGGFVQAAGATVKGRETEILCTRALPVRTAAGCGQWATGEQQWLCTCYCCSPESVAHDAVPQPPVTRSSG